MADPMKDSFQRVDFMGVHISVVDVQDLLDFIVSKAMDKSVTRINNVNVHAMNLAVSNREFRDVLNGSDVVFCDGFGVKIGAFLRGIRLGRRMTPPDWIDELFLRCVEEDLSVYALGDEEEEVAAFVRDVMQRFPALRIVGHHHGFFDVHGRENEAVVREISAAGADVVLVGMGMPRQEIWASDAASKLPKGILISTGALFRWYTGSKRRSPRWMTDHGLEWLGRLLLEPNRMWRRYVVGNPLFFWRVLTRRTPAKRR